MKQRRQVDSHLEYHLENCIGYHVKYAPWHQLRTRIRDQLSNQLLHQLKAKLRTTLYGQ